VDEQCDANRATARGFASVLVGLAILAIGYYCDGMVRFTAPALNSVFGFVLYAVPFLAIRPVRRMPRPTRSWAKFVLIPVLLFSSLLLLVRVVFNGERTRTVQIVQQGSSTIELQDYENGGAVGVHGFNLEQRRLLFRGLYLVKSVDFFDEAREGSISVEAPFTIRAHVRGNYHSDDYQTDRTYHLKPWVYF
jgi:hypothetical protein